MSKSFHLMVLTPERSFYDGPAVYVGMNSIAGTIGVMADHTPMVTALGVGELTIKVDDEKTLVAFHSEGFVEVRPDGVYLLSQACEWPEEIDVNRALEAERRAKARLSNAKDLQAMSRNRVALLRSLTRRKVKNLTNINSR